MIFSASCLLPLSSWGQAGRLMTLLVPQPAGSPPDALARKLQPMLQRALVQTVIVENLPGAGGSLGVNHLLSAAPQAATLMIASQTESILTPLALSSARYKSEDLRAVGLAGRTPFVLVGRRDLPAASLAELVALAGKLGAASLSLGHVGHGSMIHLLGELWARKCGVALNLVPYKGTPPMLQDLMGGHLDLTFLPLAGDVPQMIETGKLRAYGLSATQPSPRLPALLPFARQDARLADFVFGTWAALFVPRSLPQPMQQRLHAGVSAALQDPEVVGYVRFTGVDAAPPMTLAELGRFFDDEVNLHRSLARAIGLVPQ